MATLKEMLKGLTMTLTQPKRTLTPEQEKMLKVSEAARLAAEKAAKERGR